MDTDEDSSSSPLQAAHCNELRNLFERLHLDKRIDSYGNTLLIWAARIGQLKAVQDLIELHRLPVNNQNFEGVTALAAAVAGGYYHVAKYLIANGADVNLSNLRGECPLHLGAAIGDLDLVTLLVQEGCWLENMDECGDTPLHYSVREDHAHIVQYLLLQGADPNNENEDEETPLLLAEIVGSLAVMKLFELCVGGDATSGAAVPDGTASDSLSASYDMKVHFPSSSPRRKAGGVEQKFFNDHNQNAMVIEDTDSSVSDAALKQSGCVHSPLASLPTISGVKHGQKGVAGRGGGKGDVGGPLYGLVTVERTHHAFLHSY